MLLVLSFSLFVLWWGIAEFLPKATIGGKAMSAPFLLINISSSYAIFFSETPALIFFRIKLKARSPILAAFSIFKISSLFFIILKFLSSSKLLSKKYFFNFRYSFTLKSYSSIASLLIFLDKFSKILSRGFLKDISINLNPGILETASLYLPSVIKNFCFCVTSKKASLSRYEKPEYPVRYIMFGTEEIRIPSIL